MARPVKNTVDYFPHYCHHGGTILILERKYGIQGSGAWWKLLENLGRSEGHFIDCNNKTKWLLLQADTYFNDEQLIDYLNLLGDLNAIDATLWAKGKIIWCQNLVDKISGVYVDRRREIPKKPNLNHNKIVSTVDNPVSTADNKTAQDNKPVVSTADNPVSTADNKTAQDNKPVVSTADNPVSTADNTQIKRNEMKLNTLLNSKDNKLSPKTILKELELELKTSTNKIAVLVKAFKLFHEDAPVNDFNHDTLYGRMGQISKLAGNNQVTLLNTIYKTASDTINDSHLDYIYKFLKNKQKYDKEKGIQNNMPRKEVKSVREILDKENKDNGK